MNLENLRNRSWRILILSTFVLAIFQPCHAIAQVQDRIAVAFYNCENFFDTVDNPVKDDDDFTPRGKYHYTRKVYEQKLLHIADVLQQMDPAVMGVAEVENNAVLDALCRQQSIAGQKYRYVWFDGPDPRGINVALVYNPRLFKVLNEEPLKVNISSTGGKAITRDVLHVRGILVGDTVDVFVNHWPSRRGGEAESGAKRAIAATVNKDAFADLMRKYRNAKVIVMGDLNDNPDDNSVVKVLGAKPDAGSVSATGLFNPFYKLYKSGNGTEVYKHQWNLFDQVILSGAMLRSGKLRYIGPEIYKPAFLQDTYKGHEGEPYRSYVGTRWIGGYSDHFPVAVYFSRK
jgi:endonuclease/exonuclease/phosphatase family metal-dependent hydrolase